MTENISETTATEGRTATDERAADDAASSDPGPDTAARDEPMTLTDPSSVAEREGVSVVERTYRHEDPDHCESESAGRAIVGVTNDEGEALLVVNEEVPYAILPNATVDPDEDWAEAGREHVAEVVGVDVVLDAVECVRAVEHCVDGEGARGTTHHVVFDASLAPGETLEGVSIDDRDGEWTVGWYDGLPVDVDADAGDIEDDIRLVLE